jgi:hypothetical protein
LFFISHHLIFLLPPNYFYSCFTLLIFSLFLRCIFPWIMFVSIFYVHTSTTCRSLSLVSCYFFTHRLFHNKTILNWTYILLLLIITLCDLELSNWWCLVLNFCHAWNIIIVIDVVLVWWIIYKWSFGLIMILCIHFNSRILFYGYIYIMVIFSIFVETF